MSKKGASLAHGGPAKQPTSYDVATLAGVSQSAVSRCFRPDASISKDLRDRVLKAARKLGYAPDAIARSLAIRRSNVVGVVISNLTNLYYPEVLSEINACCTEHNIRLMLFTIQNESEAQQVVNNVWQYRLDGVIAAAGLDDEHIKEFGRRAVPLIFYNRYSQKSGVNAVCCDQQQAATAIIDGLVGAAHKRFGLIGGPPDSMVGAERISSSLARLKHHGVKDVVSVRGDYTYLGGQQALREIVRKFGRAPDAVIASNDVMALGCIDALRYEHGLSIPKDASVVGFDGVEPATWQSYGLSSVRQPVRDMAAAAVDLLVECINKPQRQAEKRVFSGTLTEGKSARLAIPRG
jgi:DNA-binding LacI/PurR family transcriptional regulator